MTTQGWRLGKRAGFSVLAAGLAGWFVTGFVACAGQDTPPVDDQLRDDLVTTYPEDETGSAGSASSGGGAAGAAGSSDDGDGGSGPSGGSGGRAGTGGSGQASGGTGGAAPSTGGGGGNVCDAYTQVFSVSCTGGGCHSEPGALIGDFASGPDAANALVDKVSSRGAACGKLIDSGTTDDSLILQMVENTQDPGACFPLPMPLGGDDLSQTDKDCIQDWLTQFAD
jgi:hypothetical protein